MTNLRKKRLLLLAKHGGNCKRFYSQFVMLEREGLTTWMLGMAFLTDKGALELDNLIKTRG